VKKFWTKQPTCTAVPPLWRMLHTQRKTGPTLLASSGRTRRCATINDMFSRSGRIEKAARPTSSSCASGIIIIITIIIITTSTGREREDEPWSSG
jgi:hypothetical protein